MGDIGRGKSIGKATQILSSSSLNMDSMIAINSSDRLVYLNYRPWPQPEANLNTPNPLPRALLSSLTEIWLSVDLLLDAWTDA